MEIIVVWILIAIGAGLLAAHRNRAAAGWALLCAILPVAILILIVLPTLAPPGTKRCPQCAERVQAAARICRFCQHKFPEPEPATPHPAPEPEEEYQLSAKELARWNRIRSFPPR